MQELKDDGEVRFVVVQDQDQEQDQDRDYRTGLHHNQDQNQVKAQVIPVSSHVNQTFIFLGKYLLALTTT